MARRFSISGTGHSQSTWPLGLLLLVAVAVPAACVLWFMTEAMRIEQLAVRGRLTSLYEGQLGTLTRRLDDLWEQKQAVLASETRDGNTPSETFAKLVRSSVADSDVSCSSVADSDHDCSSVAPVWPTAIMIVRKLLQCGRQRS